MKLLNGDITEFVDFQPSYFYLNGLGEFIIMWKRRVTFVYFEWIFMCFVLHYFAGCAVLQKASYSNPNMHVFTS